VDEVMSSWVALEDGYVAGALPHTTKIARKPRGVGIEMKAMCCVQSKIMMQLDIMEGKRRQKDKDHGSGGTGHVLRLCQPWFGSNRVVIGDSAFSSVPTAQACLSNGLHYMGILKTAHKFFPKQYLISKAVDYGRNGTKPRGDYLHLQSTVELGEREHVVKKPIFAHGWFDRKTKLIVTTCGTTVPGTDSKRERHKKVVVDGKWQTQRYFKNVPRTKLVEEMFAGFSRVDIHDHLRQGSLGLERTWITRRWYVRLFATVLGICVVDAFYAHAYEHEHEQMDFTTFCKKLTYELVKNDYDGVRRVLRREEDESDEMQV